jgi:hypothetical protein
VRACLPLLRPRRCAIMAGMLGLTDHQLDVVMDAAGVVPVKRRSIFLERTAAILRLRGRFTDADVHDVTALALCSLVRTGAAFNFEMKYWPDQSR